MEEQKNIDQLLEQLSRKIDKTNHWLECLHKIQFAALICQTHPTSPLAQSVKESVLEEGEAWLRNFPLDQEQK